MKSIIAHTLTEPAFRPFGSVIKAPADLGRLDFSETLGNSRPQAHPSLATIQVAPSQLPFTATLMERHEFSSQSFIPLTASQYLVIVAPAAPIGGPDLSQVCAFLAHPGQGITYRMDTWHHGITVLDQPAAFALLMWQEGNAHDQELVTLNEPFTVVLPDDSVGSKNS